MRRIRPFLLFLLLLAALALGCHDHHGHAYWYWGWDGYIDVDNDDNDFSFEAEDLWWEDWTFEYPWDCDHPVADVRFTSEHDFEGEVRIRIYDDEDYLVFDERFEEESIDVLLPTAPGDPGYWWIEIRLYDVCGSFDIRVRAY
jgi:hypothetical protein